ncbi:MAG: biotin/lipoyl-containing protein, partial [Candidatus Dormiibacterota bacterium]
MPEFRMPALGADMDFGTITDWRVKPGDTVKKGDIVAVVETQKATLEVEIFQSGTVDQILVPPGTRVPVGTVLAVMRNGQAPVPQAPPVAPV